MADQLTPRQLAVIRHWNCYGQRGRRPTRRVTPSDWEIREGFIHPQRANWDIPIQVHQLPVLLLGFLPSTGMPDAEWLEVGQTIAMHAMMSTSQRTDATPSADKWFVYADGPDVEGHVRLHMYRSWTGQKMIELGVQVEAVYAEYASITDITFETDRAEQEMVVTEEKAKEMAIEVCRWLMDVDLEPSSRVDYTLEELEDAMKVLPKPPGKVTWSGPAGMSIEAEQPQSRRELAEVVRDGVRGPNVTPGSSIRELSKGE